MASFACRASLTALARGFDLVCEHSHVVLVEPFRLLESILTRFVIIVELLGVGSELAFFFVDEFGREIGVFHVDTCKILG